MARIDIWTLMHVQDLQPQTQNISARMTSLHSLPALQRALFFSTSSHQMALRAHPIFPASYGRRGIPSRVSAEASPSPTQDCSKRRLIFAGAGALATGLVSKSLAYAEEVPENYQAFVDPLDGYSYYYPSDWREFDFLGHDSAFKDRFAALQHVRVGFIPTDKNDIHDLGLMEEVIFNLVKNVYAAPTQIPSIYDMQERTVDGKNYWTFEYELACPSFARTAFATIAIDNGRYYTLVVGANERRWSRVRNKLKVVADSFRLLDI